MAFIVIKKENNTFSLHGSAVNRTVKDQLNEKLGMLHKVGDCADVHFEWDKTAGHVSPGVLVDVDCSVVRRITLARWFRKCPRQTVKTDVLVFLS